MPYPSLPTPPPYLQHFLAPTLPQSSEDKDDPNVLLSSPSCRVVRQGDKVVKYGQRVTVCEQAALDYAAQLALPVPHLHNEAPPYDGCLYIWMDYIEGVCLEKVWPNMKECDRQKIATDLGNIVAAMRNWNVEPPETLGDGCYGLVLELQKYAPRFGLSCRDEASFNKFLLGGVAEDTPSKIRQELADGLRSDHRICLTHGDLFTRNIIVEGNEIRGLVDWQYGGWYPEYWEYVKFLNGRDKHPDWKNYAHLIFPEEEFADVYQEEVDVYDKLWRWQA